MTDTILVSYDNSSGDIPVLVIGRKTIGHARHYVEIINAFQGNEATDLYNKLITKKKER